MSIIDNTSTERTYTITPAMLKDLISKDLGVDASIVSITFGPALTRYDSDGYVTETGYRNILVTIHPVVPT